MRLLPVLLLALAPLLSGLRAVPADPTPLVRWTVSADPVVARHGEVVVLTLRGTIAPGWRLYAMDSPVGRPLAVRLGATRGVEALGEPQQSQPQTGDDVHFGGPYTYFEDRVTVTQAFRVGPRARSHARFEGTVRYTLCNDDVCLPPREQRLGLTVPVRRQAD